MNTPVIVLDKPGSFRLTTAGDPADPGVGEVLVRIHQVGVCGTDIHAFHGRQPFFEYPRILGHELGVEVVALGAGVTNVAVGDRCSVEPYLNCGSCIACRRGRTNCCTRLKVLGVHIDGGMRSYLTLPANKLHRSETLSYEQLALVETLAIGAHAVKRAQPEPEEWALVVGAGPIGLSVLQFAHLAGARTIVLDVSPERLAFAKAQGTAHETVIADDTALARLQELTNGDLPTAVFDATGNPAAMRRTFDYVASTGRLTLVGLVQGEVGFDDPSFHRRELTLLSSRNAQAAEFTYIISAIEAGKIDTRPWITHHAQALEFPDIFASWLTPGSGLLKGIVTFND